MSMFFFFVSHSHTVSTFQPCSCKATMFSLSRSMFLSNFFLQYSSFVRGRICACLQVGQPCQKQPFTNITVLYFGNTISGLPGKLFGWSLNLYPNLCNIFLTLISGVVFVLCTFDIISLRVFLSKVSAIPYKIVTQLLSNPIWVIVSSKSNTGGRLTINF